MAPISSVRLDAPLTRPTANDSTATASAANTATLKGTFPTSTQYTIHGAKPARIATVSQSR